MVTGGGEGRSSSDERKSDDFAEHAQRLLVNSKITTQKHVRTAISFLVFCFLTFVFWLGVTPRRWGRDRRCVIIQF